MKPGWRTLLLQGAEAVAVLPVFVTAPLFRSWHLRWGATEVEVASPLPGDGLVTTSHFTATRAITVNAQPEEVWPWVIQVGINRAGFYSYDLLDSLGIPSSNTVLPEWQNLRVGDVVAPMTAKPNPATSFVVAEEKFPVQLVWAKPDSSWSWRFTRLPGNRTRLVTRLKQHYRPGRSLLLTVPLLELADFPMMRKMLYGIKKRAEGNSMPGTR
ncbi:conserved hypothetical protein [Arthrobacter sp. 9AX]|uniref:hypothetical protein n=1 Tax=Arthrobacter sp. 9AX TaxID=2653131 RepID=UPI0012F43B36|nr:hypothetical protein [Arthrobacter sp. 9AX]VXC21805.1 conserved hypothetical protein [Arthrobacter sp. 9AX]